MKITHNKTIYDFIIHLLRKNTQTKALLYAKPANLYNHLAET